MECRDAPAERLERVFASVSVPCPHSARSGNLIAGDGMKNGPFSVGSRTGAPVGRGIPTVPRFQPPPRRTQHADFPHCAPPFASRQGLWDLSYRGNFRSVVAHSIAVEQSESVVQPGPTPLLPAEALSFPSMRQMAPDLLLYPIADVGEALARVPHREVVDPPP